MIKKRSIKRWVLRRLLERIIKTPSGCWEWQGSRDSYWGYGHMKLEGCSWYVHRLSYAVHKGDPRGLLICHKCDNPSCVNPDHLFKGTAFDNMQDAYKKGRLKMPKNRQEFKLGDIPTNRTLSDEEARKVKELIKNRGKKSLKQLALEIGVSVGVLNGISSGRTYNNIK
jgi:transcription elongation factor Elf1